MPSNSKPNVRLGNLPAAAMAFAPATPTWAASPFAGFACSWTEGGAIQTSGGQETIRCKARYTPAPGGNSLNINVNCASDSCRVNIVSDVVTEGDGFSGSWQERRVIPTAIIDDRFSPPSPRMETGKELSPLKSRHKTQMRH